MLRTLKKPLFATQIYSSQLKKVLMKAFLKDLQKEAYQIQSIDHFGLAWSQKNYVNGYTSYGSNATGFDRLHEMSSTFKDLEKSLEPHVKAFIRSLDLDIHSRDLKMTHCWINIMGKGAFHASHAHPLSVLSGTFYVEVPKGASALKFEDPRLGLFMNSPGIKSNPLLQNQRFIEIQPRNGYLVLFESWLKHEVPVNLSSKARISVSFNYGWN